ncbi:ATP-dependent DNA helicase RecG [Parasphingorhabdus halotolerans]|uniref:Probable DNA 3'-5' helicase RecG n=1 Tax=Parasphingorhabdus halotolerans TaxID=2725558 RepID=A0A6H2DHM3_9SPHN|nr:ATP-dependent DNA helicase RecG [Parasphingorhabdus halotolerans]QJB68169.1 ATP-dependent DNA helicase RecG [Parasphingorhabdus halotolerans]
MRPEILNPLFGETQSLKGVGKALAKPLEKLRLTRVKDLQYHAPSYWMRRKRVVELDEADVGLNIVAEITPVDYRSGGPRSPFRVYATDGPGNYISLTFFGRNSGWPKKLLPLGEPKVISGKLERYGDELQILHPEVLEPIEKDEIALVEPIYPLSDGLGNKRMSQLIEQAVALAPELPEWIEPSLLASKNWKSWHDSVVSLHRQEGIDAADRLAYDEVFANQLAFMLVRASNRRKTGTPIEGDGHLRDKLDLPFELTGAQKRCISEIDGDLAQSSPMLRLLQGDVGSGKTLIALMALLNAVEAGYQGALLAPTEILARQHFEGLQKLLTGLPVSLAILTGREKGRVRESTLMGLADGSIDILVGTHAIFQEKVQYKRLALAVIDEQHKFGVSQRLMLTQKAERIPHLLAMTATPIPRTLTLSQFGEMDVSKIDELPPGRQEIETRVISDGRIAEVVDGLARHVASGGQAYWVCPLVEESEKSDLAAAEDRASTLCSRFGDDVGLVHGRMKGPEKDAVMERFQRDEIKILVATTVIEVGVDVPNASLMIIEAADRFGLAQLHQLRGRVGRGSVKSNCLLLRGDTLSETARARLTLLRETNDGFRIAEEDLRLRGAGELLGTRQSGEAGFRIASSEQVTEFIAPATDDARLLLDRDGGLESERGQAARVALYLFEKDWGVSLLRSG